MLKNDECDFCSSPKVVRRFQCLDFNSESKDAGVLYNGVNLDLHSTNYWAACAECSKFVDAEDVNGLLDHVIAVFQAQTPLDPVKLFVFKRHTRHSYELFFRNRIRVAE